MDVWAFAESVLFEADLDRKLADPGDYAAGAVAPTLDLPRFPARPRTMAFFRGGHRERPLPRLDRLEAAEDRALLLHHFANHELLALELMALAILRFPSAPESFRRLLHAVMRDEQRHFRLYRDRFRSLGLDFGDRPVGRAFWDSLAEVGSPLAFVAAMNLGLEQANLDFAEEHRLAFAAAGDQESAQALATVLADELRHVRLGLALFRQWKEPGLDDHEAWLRALPPTFPPAHAKGGHFSVELRRRAGLDESFCEAMEIVSGSRGRPPVVHWLNPACEEEILDPLLEPTGPAPRLEADLGLLPIVLAAPDDLVLVTREISRDRLLALSRQGFRLPEIRLARVDLNGALGIEPMPRRISEVAPWGMSPRAERRLSHFIARRSPGAAAPELAGWTETLRGLHEKSGAKAKALAIAAEGSTLVPADRLARVADLGRTVRSAEELREVVLEVGQGRRELLLKSTLGAAGRGNLRCRGIEDRAALAFGAREIGRQGAIEVEPRLDRVFDFSAHLTVFGHDRWRFEGLSAFQADPAGRYLGSSIGRFAVLMRESLRGAGAVERPDIPIEALMRQVGDRVAGDFASRGYLGALGIDAFLFRDEDGRLRLRPLVEVNPRRTMGRIALHLGMRHLARGARGFFLPFSKRFAERLGGGAIASALGKLEADHPPRLEDEPGGPRLREGIVLLGDPVPESLVCPVFAAGEAAERLRLAAASIGASRAEAPAGTGDIPAG